MLPIITVSIAWTFLPFKIDNFIFLSNHCLCSMTSLCAHLLKSWSLKLLWMLMIWFMDDLNFAHIRFPFPLKVDVALQYRWFSHSFIHCCNSSQFFSLAILDKTFLISVKCEQFIGTLNFLRYYNFSLSYSALSMNDVISVLPTESSDWNCWN